VFTAMQGSHRVNFVSLSREQSLCFSVEEYNGKQAAVICDAVLLSSKDSLHIEHNSNALSVLVFPDNILPMNNAEKKGQYGLFTEYRLEYKQLSPEIKLDQVGSTRYTVDIPQLHAFLNDPAIKEIMLQINYQGDIGSAFINGQMISDNFCNGEPWDIGLSEFSSQLKQHPLTVYITPIKHDNKINVESVMAGRKEETGAVNGKIQSISAQLIYKWSL